MVRSRLDSIDLLRGLVMVIMALDHTRDFFSNAPYNPLDLARTDVPLFFTRWITHFCAPVFIFLAGTSAFLSQSSANGRTKGQLARFLLIRGLLLVVLELTIVHFGWNFNFDYDFALAQVIWAIGWSMVALAGLVFLPTRVVLAFGVLMIAGHNLLDNVRAASFGSASWLWTILHSPGTLEPVPGVRLYTLYSLIPWIGVMAAGYGIGPLFLRDRAERRRWLLWIGIALIAIFVVLRATNLYGDPRLWTPQKDTVFTILSFINAEKYPPSLLFLLMTLGPAFMALALFDTENGVVKTLGRPFIVFGRVPLFYYLLHLPLIHATALVLAHLQSGQAGALFASRPRSALPGYDLPVVYLVWLCIVLALFPICWLYMRLKRRYPNSVLRYL
jgi:uncharacterized membrane protein